MSPTKKLAISETKLTDAQKHALDLDNEALAEYLIDRNVGKMLLDLAMLRPYLIELAERFTHLRKGETIHGYTSMDGENGFCLGEIGRTYRACKYAMDGGNTNRKRLGAKPAETENVSVSIEPELRRSAIAGRAPVVAVDLPSPVIEEAPVEPAPVSAIRQPLPPNFEKVYGDTSALGAFKQPVPAPATTVSFPKVGDIIEERIEDVDDDGCGTEKFRVRKFEVVHDDTVEDAINNDCIVKRPDKFSQSLGRRVGDIILGFRVREIVTPAPKPTKPVTIKPASPALTVKLTKTQMREVVAVLGDEQGVTIEGTKLIFHSTEDYRRAGMLLIERLNERSEALDIRDTTDHLLLQWQDRSPEGVAAKKQLAIANGAIKACQGAMWAIECGDLELSLGDLDELENHPRTLYAWVKSYEEANRKKFYARLDGLQRNPTPVAPTPVTIAPAPKSKRDVTKGAFAKHKEDKDGNKFCNGKGGGIFVDDADVTCARCLKKMAGITPNERRRLRVKLANLEAKIMRAESMLKLCLPEYRGSRNMSMILSRDAISSA